MYVHKYVFPNRRAKNDIHTIQIELLPGRVKCEAIIIRSECPTSPLRIVRLAQDRWAQIYSGVFCERHFYMFEEMRSAFECAIFTTLSINMFKYD